MEKTGQFHCQNRKCPAEARADSMGRRFQLCSPQRHAVSVDDLASRKEEHGNSVLLR